MVEVMFVTFIYIHASFIAKNTSFQLLLTESISFFFMTFVTFLHNIFTSVFLNDCFVHLFQI